MLALPLPIVTFALAAVACVLVWRLDLGNPLARGLFTATFAVISLATLLTGLRFGYGLDGLSAVQRMLPLLIGPLIYLGFASFTRAPDRMRAPLLLHLSATALLAALPQLFPPMRGTYDVLIALSYLVYATALALLWRRGPDALARAPLDLTAGLRGWMLASAALLTIMLVVDGTIALSFAVERQDRALRLITYASAFTALCLVGAILAISARPRPRTAARPPSDAPAPLEQAARALLTDTRLYRETDLTLERLAKRLHVPARALSEAINQSQGMNVSHYVNGFRLSHAAHLLDTTDLPVTQIMEQSGFLTRSNFYREFERVFDQSPSAYRKARRAP